MHVLQTSVFKRNVKRLRKNQKAELDTAIHEIIQTPHLGDAKVGDLAGVRVHKFSISNQQMLLAYSWDQDGEAITLLALGSHKNFYRDLKR